MAWKFTEVYGYLVAQSYDKFYEKEMFTNSVRTAYDFCKSHLQILTTQFLRNRILNKSLLSHHANSKADL